MIQPIELTDEVRAALYDPSPLERYDTIGISLHETEAVGKFQRYLCLYESPEGYFARRGEQRLVSRNGNVSLGAEWIGTIEIPKHNYEKFTSKLKGLGISESENFKSPEEYLDGEMYELRVKSASMDRSVTWLNPEGPSLERLLVEIERLLVLPKYRFERISRFDRLLMWFQKGNILTAR